MRIAFTTIKGYDTIYHITRENGPGCRASAFRVQVGGGAVHCSVLQCKLSGCVQTRFILKHLGK
jgi:hypothetical protein